jgi:hypothetical protein
MYGFPSYRKGAVPTIKKNEKEWEASNEVNLQSFFNFPSNLTQSIMFISGAQNADVVVVVEPFDCLSNKEIIFAIVTYKS